jgi:hypothetical protein
LGWWILGWWSGSSGVRPCVQLPVPQNKKQADSILSVNL